MVNYPSSALNGVIINLVICYRRYTESRYYIEVM